MVKSIKTVIKKVNGGILCSLALSFLIFIYAPLELYLVNQDDFWFDIYTIFPYLMGMFLISCTVCIAVLIGIRIIRVQIYESILSALFAVFIATYVQGTFLSSNLPPLDGRNIDWNSYSFDQWLSAVLWIIICITIMIGLKKIGFPTFNKLILLISTSLLTVLVVTIGMLCIVNKGFYRKSTGISTIKNQFELSQDQNFIILLFDAVDADTFSNLLEEYPEYKLVFQDFTYYDNTICAYPYTMMSIPFILSGIWYENATSFNFYLSTALNESPLFETLEKQDFKIGIYDYMLNLDNHDNRYDNITNAPATISSAPQFAYSISQLAGIKYAPFAIKPFCYGAQEKINALRSSGQEAEYPYYGWDNPSFYRDTLKSDMAFTNDKVFKFIHLEGAHVPYHYDKNVQLIENGTYEQSIEACITMISGYLNKMKSNNVYDNSIIIVMADHGYNGLEMVEGRQHPFFLVKGINEFHELIVNHAPISYDDLQTAYARLLSGNRSNEIFDYQEGDQRERRFLFYRYLEEDHMEEFIQHGEANDLTTLTPTGRIFDRE